MPDLPRILSRLERTLGPASGEPVPVAGGITNHNFRVCLGGHDCVVRLPGRDTALLGIDRGAERLAASRAAELGIAPPLLYADDDCVVTAYLAGGPVDPDALRGDPGPVARALCAFHDSGVRLPTSFWVAGQLDEYAAVVRERGGVLPDAYQRAAVLVRRIASTLPLAAPVPCHDDLLPGNLIQTPATIMLVDWEYAGMGHRFFDLGNLAANNEFDDPAELRLLAAYFEVSEGSVGPARRAALKLFRIVSDAREAAWGVLQSQISELDFDFEEYAARHFERLELAAADPRLEEYFDAAAA